MLIFLIAALGGLALILAFFIQSESKANDSAVILCILAATYFSLFMAAGKL